MNARIKINEAIISEYDAINIYQKIIDELPADYPNGDAIKKVLASVRDEEVVHVGEFQHLLKLIEESEAKLLADGEREAQELISGKPKSAEESLNFGGLTNL